MLLKPSKRLSSLSINHHTFVIKYFVEKFQIDAILLPDVVAKHQAKMHRPMSLHKQEEDQKEEDSDDSHEN